MKRLNKKTELKKLTVDTTTIRILTEVEQQHVVGGAPPSDGAQCGRNTQTCTCRPEP